MKWESDWSRRLYQEVTVNIIRTRNKRIVHHSYRAHGRLWDRGPGPPEAVDSGKKTTGKW